MYICLISSNLNQLQALKARYIILDAGFSKIELWTLYKYSTGSIPLNSTTPISDYYGLPAVNMTGTVRTFLALMGINMTLPDSNN